MTDALEPEVTVAIPTYNRAASLDHAVAAVLAQDYPALRVLISDNGSSDGTSAVCERWGRVDERISWTRHDRNRGWTWNFNYLASQADSPFFMWHADDDVAEPGYLRACIAALQADRAAVLAGGRCVFVEDDGRRWEGEAIHLVAHDPRERVVGYYATVATSGGFYGVWRRSALERALPLDVAMGGDWHLMARGAAQGSILHLDSVAYVRQRGGTSRTYADLVADLGIPRWQADAPAFALARNAFVATVSRRSLLGGTALTRLPCALRCWRVVHTRFRAADDPRAALRSFLRLDARERRK